MADAVVEDSNMTNNVTEQEATNVTANGDKSTSEPAEVKDSETKSEKGTAGKEGDSDKKQYDDDDMSDAGKSDDGSDGDANTRGSTSPNAQRKSGRGRGRDGGRRDHWKPRRPKGKDIRTEYTDMMQSDDPDEIRSQVEFYFSDSNLPIDNYLLKLTGGHENKPVDLKVIHDFKRMQHFQPYSAVVNAIKESDVLNLDDDDQITRKVPLDATFTLNPLDNRIKLQELSLSRSVYAKGFGHETKSMQPDIEEFFAPYGPTKSVRMRRFGQEGTFKGSVFVEFADEETQQRFLALEPKPQFKGQDLKIMSKADYIAEKPGHEETGQAPPRRNFNNNNNGRRGKPYNKRDNRDNRNNRKGSNHQRPRSRDRDEENGGNKRRRLWGNVDPDEWKQRRELDQEQDKREREKRKRQPSPDEIDKKSRDYVEKANEGEVAAGAQDSTAGEPNKKRALDGGETQGDAKKVKAEGDAPEGGNDKKRAAIDAVEGEGEAKKAKKEDVEA